MASGTLSPGRAERRREKFILWHILIIACLLVVGLWGFLGVLPPGSEMVTSYWCRVYWDAEDDRMKLQALEHLFEETGFRANRVFSNARYRGSPRLQRFADRWFATHNQDSELGPSW